MAAFTSPLRSPSYSGSLPVCSPQASFGVARPSLWNVQTLARSGMGRRAAYRSARSLSPRTRVPYEPARFCSATLAPFRRRAFDWSLEQVKHALAPTIFFFVGFNLILWTKRLILEEQGIEFSGFFIATEAALLVGKAVLVTDNLPFMRRFDGAPLTQPILFKSAIYWLCVLIVRLAEGLVHFLTAGGVISDFPEHLVQHFSWPRFQSI